MQTINRFERALEMIQFLSKGNEVGRWNIFSYRKELRELYLKPEYIHLQDKIEEEIELAKESI